jgi:mitogen-activated protein kinase kinase kinase
MARTNLNSMTGTPMYMSPEGTADCYLPDKGRRGALDIWSLGCCILEMATGRRPWANLDNEWAVCFILLPF